MGLFDFSKSVHELNPMSVYGEYKGLPCDHSRVHALNDKNPFNAICLCGVHGYSRTTRDTAQWFTKERWAYLMENEQEWFKEFPLDTTESPDNA